MRLMRWKMADRFVERAGVVEYGMKMRGDVE